ncbi:MAG: glycosyltransferase [Muribaculaceae bacterium]|nr:glycosyltransferase [Muribaculaceae bacterium]MEE1021989.1 glycosyltransferase [Muribaculaceae bacterium]
MRVLQLGKFYPIKGGVEKVMLDIMQGMAARGVDCDMMCAASEGRGKTVSLSDHSRLLTSRTWVKVASTTISPSMISTLRRVANGYDIIHVHHPDPMAALALRLSGFKGRVVLHWHSDIVKQKRLFRYYAPLQNWLIRRADVVVGTSAEYVAHSPHLEAARDKLAAIPIGVRGFEPDEEVAERVRSRWPGRKIVFFLGRLIAYKGLEYLVAAAVHLPDDYVIAVGGEGPLRASLEEQIHAQGLDDKVYLMGEIPQEDLAGWYTACELFCLPSVMKTEAFGIVQIEAMSVGRPVVATNIEGSGTGWVNKHGYSGLNVPVRDARALAKAITDVTADAKTYARYCRQARQRFEERFVMERMIDDCEALYRKLLSEK